MKTEIESGRWAKQGRGCWNRYLLWSTGAPIIVGYEYKACVVTGIGLSIRPCNISVFGGVSHNSVRLV